MTSVAFLSVPEIIRGTLKLWAAPGYAHAPFCPKVLMAFCSDMDPVNVPAKFDVRSFIIPAPEIIVQSLDTPFKVIQGH